ncbi:MAG: hypothetical protein ACJARZ_000899 [Dokdonia sp.]|jgi:hypothetical protein
MDCPPNNMGNNRNIHRKWSVYFKGDILVFIGVFFLIATQPITIVIPKIGILKNFALYKDEVFT